VFYLIYIVVSAGAATHMSGRFFALPFFVAAVVFVDCLVQPRSAVAVAVGLGIFIAWSPVSALKFGTAAYHHYEQQKDHIDTKLIVYRHGAALANWRPGRKLPDHAAYHYGAQLRKRPMLVHVGGADGKEAIGFVGYAAGPKTHFIDKVGLGDPLLARLPALRPPRMASWKSGHCPRAIPPGYVKSILRNENLLVDPDLRRYYAALRLVTRGPLFSGERLVAIWNFQLGRYDHLLPESPPSL
jgi:arabinofuranosyltransferase